jgi:hypothetical protein
MNKTCILKLIQIIENNAVHNDDTVNIKIQ